MLPKVVVPAALDNPTRQVLEALRRDGYQVPEFLVLDGFARTRIEEGADPDAYIPHWRIETSDGQAPPMQPWGFGDYLKGFAARFVTVFALAILVTVTLSIGATVTGANIDRLLLDLLIGFSALSPLGGMAAVALMRRFHPSPGHTREEVARYELTYTQLFEIRQRAVPVDPQWPEVRLAAVAAQLAARIEKSAAWTDTVLDEHRMLFSPSRESEQVKVHALRIASMRARLGEVPAGDTADHEQARAALQMEHDLLDRILLSLRQRVAALWSYASTVEELSSQVSALRAIENSMSLAPELDALARQTGVDELVSISAPKVTRPAPRTDRPHRTRGERVWVTGESARGREAAAKFPIALHENRFGAGAWLHLISVHGSWSR